MRTTARKRVQEFIRERPGATATQIARGLGMTAPAVRHHLAILTSDGRVEIAKGGRESRQGRPAQRYRLADPLVGDNLAMVADVALKVLSASGKVATKRRLVEALAAELVARTGPLDPRGPAARRLTVLVGRLSERHYAAHWEAGASGPKVILGRCPYAAVIRNHPELCQMDARALADLTGQSAAQIARMDLEHSTTTQCIFLLR